VRLNNRFAPRGKFTGQATVSVASVSRCETPLSEVGVTVVRFENVMGPQSMELVLDDDEARSLIRLIGAALPREAR